MQLFHPSLATPATFAPAPARTAAGTLLKVQRKAGAALVLLAMLGAAHAQTATDAGAGQAPLTAPSAQPPAGTQAPAQGGQASTSQVPATQGPSTQGPSTQVPQTAPAEGTGSAPAGPATTTATTEPPAPPAPPAKPGPRVSLKTSMGTIVIEVDPERAPKSSANFLAYTKSGFYTGTIFHRVIKDFMIQTGQMDAKYAGKPSMKPIPLESKNGLTNVKYSVAMARTEKPNSATSSFFINTKDNPGLDFPGGDGTGGYAVFGRVVEGFDVVHKIENVVTDDKKGMQDVPVTPIVIRSATLLKAVK